MFVSVILDPGSIESAQALSQVLAQYGFKKVQRSCWECALVTDIKLNSLKRDIDAVTDYYDLVRLYQFPVEEVLAVTELVHKKWRKMIMRFPDEE